MDVLHHRVHTAPHLADASEIGKVSALHTVDIAFFCRQHHFPAGIFGFIFCLAPGLKETKVIEEFAERDPTNPLFGQFARLLLVVRQIQGAQDPDALTQTQSAPSFPRFFLICFDQLAQEWRLRNQNRRRDALAGTPTHGLFADRECLKQGWVWPLVGLGYDIDLLYPTLFVYLTREAELPRPLMG